MRPARLIKIFTKLIILIQFALSQSAWAEPGEPVQLNQEMIGYGDVHEYKISPASNRVVYTADVDIDGELELYSVPITGGTPVKLSVRPWKDHGNGMNSRLTISPDGSRVFYMTEMENSERQELYSVPIDGGDAVKLSEMINGEWRIGQLEITHDSSRVVFSTYSNDTGGSDLYIVPVTGGTPVKLSSSLALDVVPKRFDIAKDDSRVIYLSDAGVSGQPQLYSVPTIGGTSIRLSWPVGFNGSVSSYFISGDGSRVVYKLKAGDQGDHLFSVPFAGGISTRLTDIGNTIIVGYGPTDAGDQVVFDTRSKTHNYSSLYAVPIVGGTAIHLFSSLEQHGILGYKITKDGRHVVYVGFPNCFDCREYGLYSVPIGGGNPVQLNDPMNHSGTLFDFSFSISDDSSRVLYTEIRSGDYHNHDLYSVPVTGGDLVKISEHLDDAGLRNLRYLVTKNNQVIYRNVDFGNDNIADLYMTPISGGPVEILNPPMPYLSHVTTYQLSLDGNYVVYMADQDIFDRFELYAVELNPQDNDCHCDVDENGVCDLLDYNAFRQDWQRSECRDSGESCRCDVDENGVCDLLDYNAFRQDWQLSECRN